MLKVKARKTCWKRVGEGKTTPGVSSLLPVLASTNQPRLSSMFPPWFLLNFSPFSPSLQIVGWPFFLFNFQFHIFCRLLAFPSICFEQERMPPTKSKSLNKLFLTLWFSSDRERSPGQVLRTLAAVSLLNAQWWSCRIIFSKDFLVEFSKHWLAGIASLICRQLSRRWSIAQ